MAKSTRLQSRRKWALGGVGLLLGIGLITTAGATWIIGANAGSTDNNVDVAVDTVQNKSVKLTASLSDSSITLGEIKDSSLSHSGIVGFENGNGDLSITFSEIKVEYGSSFVAVSEHLQLSFEIKYGTGHEANNKNLVMADGAILSKIHTEAKTEDSTGGSGTADAWTYIDIASTNLTIDIPKATGGNWVVDTTSNTSLYTAKGTNITFNFTWGSFFGGMSPANYYNHKITGESATYDTAANIEKELNAMKDRMNENTLVLTTSVTSVAGN